MTAAHKPGGVTAMLVALAVLWILALSAGSSGWDAPWQWWRDELLWHIVRDVRAPRAVAAMLAGALLALSGATAQGLLRNPLADPYLLGSASGAALGWSLALLASGAVGLQWGWWQRLGLNGAAFAGAALAVVLALALARGAASGMRLILAGVVVGVVLGAVVQMLQWMQPQLLPAAQAFAMGSTAFVGWDGCLWMAGVLLVCVLVAWLLGPVLDALRLGEATASSLGLHLQRWRVALIALVALATATAVAQTGLIAFVGLVAPHLARQRQALPHARLTLAAALAGGVLLLGADTLARVLLAPQELPPGVLTAGLGGLYLLVLMHRQDSRE